MTFANFNGVMAQDAANAEATEQVAATTDSAAAEAVEAEAPAEETADFAE